MQHPDSATPSAGGSLGVLTLNLMPPATPDLAGLLTRAAGAGLTGRQSHRS